MPPTDFMTHPSAVQTPEQAVFEHMGYGMSLHFSMNTFTGHDYDEGNAPSETYAPSKLDVQQWARTAREAGMSYAVLTAKHMSGFCLWPSAGYDYDVTTSGNTTDVVRAFVEACQAEGIHPGLYYCILDPHNEGKVDWSGSVSPEYYRLILHHLTELHTHYKGVFYQILDIPGKLSPAQRDEVYSLIKLLNPTCLVMMNQTLDISRRNQGRIADAGAWPTDIVNAELALPPSEGHKPHMIVNGQTYYLPMESWNITDVSGSGFWFWNPNYKVADPDALFELYRKCQKGQSNFLLNVGPDNTGQIPQDQVQALMGLKHRIDAFSELLHSIAT